MQIYSVKKQLIVFLIGFALVLIFRDSAFVLLGSMIIAVLSSVGFDTLLSFLFKKKVAFSQSALITGLIIGFVLQGEQSWWIIIFASSLALASKYLIRYKGKHVFNPAAFGIFLSMVLLKAHTQWMGTYEWIVLLPVGTYFAYRIRKLSLVFSYGFVALSLFAVQAVSQAIPVMIIFFYLSYFFIFIMIIEPKTTPVTLLGKIIFGGLLGALIFILTEGGARFDVELSALLLCNMTVPLLNHLKPKKGESK